MLEIKLDLLEIERMVHMQDHDVDAVVESDISIAECLIELGRWEDAARHADGLEDLYHWFGDLDGKIRIHLVRAKAYLELREFDKASTPLVDAQAMAAWSEDKVDWRLLANVEEMRAFSHSLQGFSEDAERIEKSVSRIREILEYEKLDRESEEING